MTAATLLSHARTLGATFALQGDRVKVRATAPLPDDLLASLRAHKDALLRLLQAVPPSEVIDRLLAMPLDQFEREGVSMEIRVPWLEDPLWFAPSTVDAASLVEEGVGRGRIWTAQELRGLLAIPGITAERVRTVATAKASFEGTVAGGERLNGGRDRVSEA